MFYRWQDATDEAKIVEGGTFCPEKFRSTSRHYSARGEDDRTFLQDNEMKDTYMPEYNKTIPGKVPDNNKIMKLTITKPGGTACGVYLPHQSKVGEGNEYPDGHVKSDYDDEKDQREQLFAAGSCFKVEKKEMVDNPPTRFEVKMTCLDPRVDIDDRTNAMFPFVRRNVNVDNKDLKRMKRIARIYDNLLTKMEKRGEPKLKPNQYAPILCLSMEMAIDFPTWKCKAGNLIAFEEMPKKSKFPQIYVWIQIPKCYEKYSKEPGFLLERNEFQCEILVYQAGYRLIRGIKNVTPIE